MCIYIYTIIRTIFIYTSGIALYCLQPNLIMRIKTTLPPTFRPTIKFVLDSSPDHWKTSKFAELCSTHYVCWSTNQTWPLQVQNAPNIVSHSLTSQALPEGHLASSWNVWQLWQLHTRAWATRAPGTHCDTLAVASCWLLVCNGPGHHNLGLVDGNKRLRRARKSTRVPCWMGKYISVSTRHDKQTYPEMASNDSASKCLIHTQL